MERKDRSQRKAAAARKLRRQRQQHTQAVRRQATAAVVAEAAAVDGGGGGGGGGGYGGGGNGGRDQYDDSLYASGYASVSMLTSEAPLFAEVDGSDGGRGGGGGVVRITVTADELLAGTVVGGNRGQWSGPHAALLGEASAGEPTSGGGCGSAQHVRAQAQGQEQQHQDRRRQPRRSPGAAMDALDGHREGKYVALE